MTALPAERDFGLTGPESVLRAVVPGAGDGQLKNLPGVRSVTRVDDKFELVCSNSDAALQALIAHFPSVHGIEIVSAASRAGEVPEPFGEQP